MQDALPLPSDLKLDLPAIYMMDPVFQSITEETLDASRYSTFGLPFFVKGIAIANVLSGILNGSPVRTNVVGIQCSSDFRGSKTWAVQESISICLHTLDQNCQRVLL